MPKTIRIKRVYEQPSLDDGRRVLVDRVWPRGVSKEAAAVDAWAKHLAPSTELRKWFGHDPARFAEFEQRYRDELHEQSEALDLLLTETTAEMLTLIYSAKDERHNQAVVLAAVLREHTTDSV